MAKARLKSPQFDPDHLRQVILNIAKIGIEAMEPILTAGGKIAQIGVEIQFFPDFGNPNPAAALWLESL